MCFSKWVNLCRYSPELLQPDCHVPEFGFFTRYFVVVGAPALIGGILVSFVAIKATFGYLIAPFMKKIIPRAWLRENLGIEDDDDDSFYVMVKIHYNHYKVQFFKGLTTKATSEDIRQTGLYNFRAMLTLLDISYIFLAKATLQYFDCVKDPASGIYYLDAEPTIRCFDFSADGWETSTYTRYFILACVLVVIYPFGIIVAFSVMLWKLRFKLQRPETIENFGFLYVGYRPTWYFYKIVVLLRQLGIVAATMLFSTPVGLVTLNPAVTHSLKALDFNP
jgi:hypothetical protein